MASDPAIASFPATFRKVAFLRTPKGPGALVFIKPNADDCAAAVGKQTCRLFLMQREATGRWRLVTSVEHRFHPVALSIQNGVVRNLWVSAQADPLAGYRKLLLADNEVMLEPEAYSAEQVALQAHWELDDRNASDLQLAVRVSSQQGESALAPARVLSDAIHVREDWSPFAIELKTREAQVSRIRQLRDEERALVASLTASVQGDVNRVAQRFAWPQVLDVRARKCTDWMVPRTFWLTEARRLSSPGFCTDLIFWATSRGLLKGAVNALGLARLYLFDEIGAAYISRVLNMTLAERRTLRSPARLDQYLQLAAGVGSLLADRAGVQTLAEREAAYRLDQVLSQHWFVEVEEPNGFVVPTPELSRYGAHREHRRLGLQCARALVNTSRPSCDADTARLLQQAIREIR